MKSLLLVLILMLAVLCQGAELPDAPSHKFFDKKNVALYSAFVTAVMLDGHTTQNFLRYQDTQELNLLAKPFVYHHWKGQMVANGIGIGSTVLASYAFHKRGHHRLERLSIIGATAWETFLVVNNYRLIGWAKQEGSPLRQGW